MIVGFCLMILLDDWGGGRPKGRSVALIQVGELL